MSCVPSLDVCTCRVGVHVLGNAVVPGSHVALGGFDQCVVGACAGGVRQMSVDVFLTCMSYSLVGHSAP